MKDIEYTIVKIISKLKREKHKETIINFFQKQGIQIGRGTNICCNIVTSESHLIKIGENVTIAGHVEFVTHDNSISKVLPNTTDLFGEIVIGDNCFIGARAVIMYGVTLAPNTIVAAGSVVTKSFMEGNIIIGGNPAHKITTWENFEKKSRPFAWNLNDISREQEIKLHKQGIRLVKRE